MYFLPEASSDKWYKAMTAVEIFNKQRGTGSVVALIVDTSEMTVVF
jgi:hypothetical protein